MNFIPDDIGKYDFCWSSCAIEHVGGLDKSKQFLKNMVNLLKPGGIAVHTTEFNLSSDDDTTEEGYNVIYRKKDILELKDYFTSQGYIMDVSFKRGTSEADMFISLPPFYVDNEKYHLALFADGYIATSFGIVIRKPL